MITPAIARQFPGVTIASYAGRRFLVLLLFIGGTAPIARAAGWIQKAPTHQPSPRDCVAMVFDAAHQEVVLFGGCDLSGSLGDTWVWNGTDWTQRTPSTSPPARQHHAMAYDAARGEVVLFGGNSGLNDTWTWDGVNWTQKFPSVSPSPRSLVAMTYDANRSLVVLFGGYDGSAIGDTWTWDGATWSQDHSTASPSARYYAALEYDQNRNESVLFAGYGPPTMNDTWTYDGVNWAQQTPATSPPARSGSRIAADPSRSQLVLFGGGDGMGGFLGDTWAWSGSDWSLQSVTVHPSARATHGMTYDSLRDQIVLFGGASNSDIFNDTWVWGTSYASLVQPPINADGSSVFKAKRGVVPVKFTLSADGSSTCTLPPGSISLVQTSGGNPGPVNESVYNTNADNGSNFRISGCQYVYNLGTSSLGTGSYLVSISIEGAIVGTATFALN